MRKIILGTMLLGLITSQVFAGTYICKVGSLLTMEIQANSKWDARKIAEKQAKINDISLSDVNCHSKW